MWRGTPTIRTGTSASSRLANQEMIDNANKQPDRGRPHGHPNGPFPDQLNRPARYSYRRSIVANWCELIPGDLPPSGRAPRFSSAIRSRRTTMQHQGVYRQDGHDDHEGRVQDAENAKSWTRIHCYPQIDVGR